MQRLLCLKASAGSGKTFSLALRYIALLYKGARPSEILAVTFTNKAANEMRSRIIENLRHLEAKEEFLQALAKECDEPAQKLLARRQEILEQFLTSDIHITTIDSFLQSVVRKFSLYAGIETDFEVTPIDEDLVWHHFVEGQERFEDLVAFARLTDPRPLFRLLYEKDKELPDPSLITLPSYSIERYRAIQRQLQDLVAECSKSAQELLQKDPEAFLRSDRVWRIWQERSLQYKGSIFKKCYSEALERHFFALIDAAKEFLLSKEGYLRWSMLSFYDDYRTILRRYVLDARRLHFKEIEHLAYDLLRKRIDTDFLYFRLDAQIRHILIDEFQDTSLTQWRIFEPLVREIAASSEGFRTFFYVGDTKQAIYRFRGGSSELFDHIYEELRSFGMRQESLRINYRSKPVIVEFVNELFGLTEGANEAEGGYVEVCTNPFLEHRGSKAVHEWRPNLKTSLHKLFEAGVEPSDIAILVYRNDTLLEVADFLHELGIEAITSTQKEVIHQPKAKALIDALKAIYYQEKGALYRANFNTFVGRKFDEPIEIEVEKPARMIKTLADRYALWDEAVVELLKHAVDYPDLLAFVEGIDRFDGQLPPKHLHGVQIMTVHKSKGLEFDHVILLDTQFDPEPDTVIFDYDKLELKNIRIKTRYLDRLDPEYAAALAKERHLIEQDALNREYVAYTRAKRSLIVLKNEKKSALLALERAGITQLQRGTISLGDKGGESGEQEPLFEGKLTFYGKQQIKKEREYRPNDYEAIYLGLALHALFEMEGSDYARNRYGSYCDMHKAYALYEQAKEYPLYQDLLDGAIFREIPFVYKGEFGVIDLLVKREDELVVIDYKSAKPEDERPYLNQVRFYKKAMEALHGKPVRAYLFYVDRLEMKEVE